jgi:hypothetical protein
LRQAYPRVFLKRIWLDADRSIRLPRRPKQTFLGYPTNARFGSFVFAEFFRKTGKATFANSAWSQGMAMTKHPQQGNKDPRAKREARLAAQLRENLKRRKAQARARTNAESLGKATDGEDAEPGQS